MASSSAVRWSTDSRRALPGLKCGTRFSGMATLSPERGLRPMRGGPPVDRKAAKAANLNAVPCNQCVIHGVQNGLDGKFGIAMGELAKPVGEFFNKVGACHGKNF